MHEKRKKENQGRIHEAEVFEKAIQYSRKYLNNNLINTGEYCILSL
jgi:hypothetical protein